MSDVHQGTLDAASAASSRAQDNSNKLSRIEFVIAGILRREGLSYRVICKELKLTNNQLTRDAIFLASNVDR